MRRTLFALTGALILTAGVAAPASAGPPWISIEIPANPFNQSTRNAFCLVRVYHHGDPAYYPVSGSAEGLVDGSRRTVALSLKDTGIPGLYAVNYQPAKDGSWLLLLKVGDSDKEAGGATVVVRLDREGQIARATVPTRRQGQFEIPVGVTAADIDRMLRQQVAQAARDDHRSHTPWALAGLALIPLALVSRRRD